MEPRTGKSKLLLVDDERDITYTLKKGLEMYGFEVDTYNDPSSVLANYKPNYYDFHVIDVRMPGINGFQLAREIWQVNPSAEVCFLTSFEIYKQEAKRLFPKLSSYCFLKKPIPASLLARHFQTHLTTLT